jgi:hypothetical protein
MRVATEYYACDVLFVHRDAERPGEYATRRRSIREAARQSSLEVPAIPIVPVRMTEAWLLHDEAALRRAAGRPNGDVPLELPSPQYFERTDAKAKLSNALRKAADLTGRRARKFSPLVARSRLATLIEDFTPLRRFESFQDLERDVATFCASWAERPS